MSTGTTYLRKDGRWETRVSLRHAAASNAIEAGFDVKTLSEVLGHSRIEITMNLYVHSNMDRKVYVKVSTDFEQTGYMQPRSVTWSDGRTFQIKKVKDFRPASIYRDDCHGYCFTVMIRGEEKHLFFEPADSTFASRIGRLYVMTMS